MIATRAGWLAAAALFPTFMLMTLWSVRMARADYEFRKGTLPGTEEALRLEPDNSSYDARLAEMTSDDDPGESDKALERAVSLNPWDSQSWVELGLRAEAAGDQPRAESSLLWAAHVDKQYFPIWSLANYYFRRGDSERFWVWAQKAIPMFYGDLTPLFSLCWKLGGDGALIERRLDIRNADLEANYLTYLVAQGQMDAMTLASRRLLAWNREADTPLLLKVCDRLIEDGRGTPAMDIWNRLAQADKIPYGFLAPGSGSFLTNADFTVLPTSRAFDWQLPNSAGVSASLAEWPRGLRLLFSGRQPESCTVLTQILPVIPGSSYELKFLYRTAGIAPQTGLAWRITDVGGQRTIARGESLSSDNEREEKFLFPTLAGSSLVRLTLVYQRALGTTRIEGSIVLRKLRLTPA